MCKPGWAVTVPELNSNPAPRLGWVLGAGRGQAAGGDPPEPVGGGVLPEPEGAEFRDARVLRLESRAPACFVQWAGSPGRSLLAAWGGGCRSSLGPSLPDHGWPSLALSQWLPGKQALEGLLLVPGSCQLRGAQHPRVQLCFLPVPSLQWRQVRAAMGDQGPGSGYHAATQG